MAAANPESPVVDRPEMTAANREESPVVDDGSGARDLRLGLILLGVPAFVALAPSPYAAGYCVGALAIDSRSGPG